MAWDDLVVGGIDKPRILLLSDNNFCTNPFFIKNLDGWTAGGSATLARVEDINAYLQWMCEVTFTSTSDYVEYTYDLGSSIADRKFLFALNVVSASDFTLVFAGDIEFDSDLITSRAGKSFIVGTATGVTGNTVSIRIYGSGSLRFDNVFFAEVFEDITLPQPHDSGKLMFRKEVSGRSELWTGKQREYNPRWVPEYESEYFYLTEGNENYRQLISEYKNLFLIPHLDYDYGFVGEWKPNKFERGYSFNQYDGHEGILSIVGMEYLNQTAAVDLVIIYQVLVTAYLPGAGEFETTTGTLVLQKRLFNVDGSTEIFDSDIQFKAIVTGPNAYSEEFYYSVNTPVTITNLIIDGEYIVSDDQSFGSYDNLGSVPADNTFVPTIINPNGIIINSSKRTSASVQVVAFYNDGNFRWSDSGSPATIELLVAAGGGSGGGNRGGGGGGGGLIYNATYSIVSGDHTGGVIAITVGAGGIADIGAGLGIDGSNSSFGTQIAIGGGKGDFITGGSGANGGSGGGAGSNPPAGSGGTATVGQGYAGGANAGAGDNPRTSGGGGGAGSVGLGVNQRPDGGAGFSCSITGAAIIYSAGGGGGDAGVYRTSYGKGLGGSSSVGGDGGGKITSDYIGLNGTTYGSGGGGGGCTTIDAGKGGDGKQGIVILKYTGSSPI